VEHLPSLFDQRNGSIFEETPILRDALTGVAASSTNEFHSEQLGHLQSIAVIHIRTIGIHICEIF